MARKRMIDPGIWKSMAEWSVDECLVFICAITQSDDEGKGKVRDLKFDLINKVADVPATARKLKGRDNALLVYGDGKFFQLPGWVNIQKVPRPTKSQLPNHPQWREIVPKPFQSKYTTAFDHLANPTPQLPLFNDESVNDHGGLSEPSVNDHGGLSDGSVRTQ